jgi:hypothetical protein
VLDRDTKETWERAVITELGDEASCRAAELRHAETFSTSSAMMHPPQCGMVTCNCSALVAHTRCGAASGLGVTEPVLCNSLAHVERSFFLGPCFFGGRARVPAGLFRLRPCRRDADKRGTILLSARPGGKSWSANAIGSHDGSRDRETYFSPVSVAVARALD